MPIRMNETDRYLIKTWHFIVFHEDDKMQQVDFTESKSGRVNLYHEITRLLEKKLAFKLYGVWQGQWKTDVFDLDPRLYLKRLEDYIKKENPKFQKY